MSALRVTSDVLRSLRRIVRIETIPYACVWSLAMCCDVINLRKCCRYSRANAPKTDRTESENRSLAACPVPTEPATEHGASVFFLGGG